MMKNKMIKVGLIISFVFLSSIFLVNSNNVVTQTQTPDYVYSEENTISISQIGFPVDIKIVFDTKAALKLISLSAAFWNIGQYILNSLNSAFIKYFGLLIDFNAGYHIDNVWTIYDPNGWGGTTTYLSDYWTWMYDSSIRWKQNKDLPVQTSINKEFDIIIMITSDNINGMALTKRPHQLILVNLDQISTMGWTTPNKAGFSSVIMHEMGHIFGITGEGQRSDLTGSLDSTGDTDGYRKSVMDYHYSKYGYADKYDLGHLKTILTNIANCVN